jgi:methionyl-tRNA synthetase
MNKRFYLTTAIDYVNGEPHLGHAYEKVVTDVLARMQRSRGREVFFLTGADEHGQKVQQAAQAQNLSPQAYCDQLAALWKSFVVQLNISNDDYIRTTEPRHKEVVQAILSKLHAAGHFYKAPYKGFYSTKEETFLTEKDRQPDGNFAPVWGQVVELVEENYYFRLKEHQSWLIDYIKTNPGFIVPDYRRNEVLGFLTNNELEDLCISRPASRLSWGIPLPFDSSYVTYVWFDALSNYVTLTAAYNDPLVLNALRLPAKPEAPTLSLWPADIQVVGKDIVKFHAVYWPIMLRAMELPLPRQLVVHGWWQKEGQKMSKTLGNVVDPLAVIREWGLDAFRFYVLRELAVGPDGNWKDEGFQSRYQSELANGLGNLLNRSVSMLQKYRQGIVPGRSDELAADAEKAVRETLERMDQADPQGALIAIGALITRANQYVDQTAPFKLAKDPAQSRRLDDILYNLAETCRILAVLLWPFLPDSACKIYSQLGFSEPPSQMSLAQWGGLAPGHQAGAAVPLFPRKDQPKT